MKIIICCIELYHCIVYAVYNNNVCNNLVSLLKPDRNARKKKCITIIIIVIIIIINHKMCNVVV